MRTSPSLRCGTLPRSIKPLGLGVGVSLNKQQPANNVAEFSVLGLGVQWFGRCLKAHSGYYFLLFLSQIGTFPCPPPVLSRSEELFALHRSVTCTLELI